MYPHVVSFDFGYMLVQLVKNPPIMQEMQETWVWSLGWKDPLEEGMATHSSILAWRIPWTEEPGGLQCMGLQRVRHDWATKHSTETKGWKFRPGGNLPLFFSGNSQGGLGRRLAPVWRNQEGGSPRPENPPEVAALVPTWISQISQTKQFLPLRTHGDSWKKKAGTMAPDPLFFREIKEIETWGEEAALGPWSGDSSSTEESSMTSLQDFKPGKEGSGEDPRPYSSFFCVNINNPETGRSRQDIQEDSLVLWDYVGAAQRKSLSSPSF